MPDFSKGGEFGGSGGGGGGSSLTPGTTVITSGTDKAVLFEDAGKVGENVGLTFDKSVPVLKVGDPTANADRQMQLRQMVGSNFGSFYAGSLTPDGTNYAFGFSSAATLLNTPSSGILERRVGNTTIDSMDSTGITTHKYAKTNTAGGTTGNRTINQLAGTVNFAAAATSLTVTNSLVVATSIVFAVVRTNDSTALIKNVVCAAGSFVITLNAAATAETSVGFFVIP